jgi:hypothetical protein
MADQVVPQGTDGVPELIEGVAVDRQSRRYAHTLRRGDQSSPVRVPGASSSLDTLDDQFDIATTTKPKPPRTAEPPPLAESTHRTSAPSESTALYRKRTNPSMPALSPDVLTRATPPAPPPEAAPSTLAMPPTTTPPSTTASRACRRSSSIRSARARWSIRSRCARHRSV